VISTAMVGAAAAVKAIAPARVAYVNSNAFLEPATGVKQPGQDLLVAGPFEGTLDPNSAIHITGSEDLDDAGRIVADGPVEQVLSGM